MTSGGMRPVTSNHSANQNAERWSSLRQVVSEFPSAVGAGNEDQAILRLLVLLLEQSALEGPMKRARAVNDMHPVPTGAAVKRVRIG